MATRTRRGRLIVIEGSDGSGKATQSRLLLRRLRAEGVLARRIAFPQYGKSFFGGMVAAYLRGEFGKAGAVDPRVASVLYAGDRFEARARVRKWLESGVTVICDRYVDSNKAHQAARLRDGASRAAFIKWIDQLEYSVFDMPSPDFTVFLHVPEKVAGALILRKGRRAYLRGRKRDIHEADRAHLQRAGSIYLELAKGRSRAKGTLIDCIEAGRLLSKGEIAARVWTSVRSKF